MISKNFLSWQLKRELTEDELKVIEILNNICIYGSNENENILKSLIMDLMINNELIQKEIINLYPNKTDKKLNEEHLKLKIELQNKIYE